MKPAEKKRYRVVLHRSRNGYFAIAPDFPGCLARGATEVEAVENARACIRAYLELAVLFARQKPAAEVEISA